MFYSPSEAMLVLRRHQGHDLLELLQGCPPAALAGSGRTTVVRRPWFPGMHALQGAQWAVHLLGLLLVALPLSVRLGQLLLQQLAVLLRVQQLRPQRRDLLLHLGVAAREHRNSWRPSGPGAFQQRSRASVVCRTGPIVPLCTLAVETVRFKVSAASYAYLLSSCSSSASIPLQHDKPLQSTRLMTQLFLTSNRSYCGGKSAIAFAGFCKGVGKRMLQRVYISHLRHTAAHNSTSAHGTISSSRYGLKRRTPVVAQLLAQLLDLSGLPLQHRRVRQHLVHHSIVHHLLRALGEAQRAVRLVRVLQRLQRNGQNDVSKHPPGRVLHVTRCHVPMGCYAVPQETSTAPIGRAD